MAASRRVRVVFFDLGGTLIDAAGRPYPHVPGALATVARFKASRAARASRASGGHRLLTALVSDFDLVDPPATTAKVKSVFGRYLAMLAETGLLPHFEPVNRRVTLSTHAGVMKPDAAVFRLALTRLRSTASLAQCLLVTEHAGHVRAARQSLHMQALQFGTRSGPGYDFHDWCQLPGMVAHLIEGTPGANTRAALRWFLHTTHAFDAETIEAQMHGRRLAVHGTLWTPVETPAQGGERLHLPFPTSGIVTCGEKGEFSSVRIAAPGATEVAEAQNFVRSLTRHGQLRGARGPLEAATHAIEVDDQGRRKLVRRRFSAV